MYVFFKNWKIFQFSLTMPQSNTDLFLHVRQEKLSTNARGRWESLKLMALFKIYFEVEI